MIFSDLLDRRVRSDPARPLITCYAGPDRTELSAATFANWVDKTATMLIDTVGADPGDSVAVRLARGHPGHWMTLIWHAAIWRAGLVADVRERPEAAVDVVGPELELSDRAADHLACSLHPLGLGFTEALPAGVVDWAAEVKAEPDVFTGLPPDSGAPAWVDDGQRLTQARLSDVEPVPDRVLVVPADPWRAVCDALLGPLAGGGSSVVVPADADLAHLGRIERAR